MAGLMQLVAKNYNEALEYNRAPHVDQWLFMSGPLPVVSITLGYLYFVLKLGPDTMTTRKPFNLQLLMVVYNLFQVLFNVWIAIMPLRLGVMSYVLKHSCHAQKENPYSYEISYAAWWYFFSKVIELLDTVFFVLRKKQKQVSFLHVYHHANTMLFSWMYLKYLPGEQGIIIGVLNASVHIFMYTYYMIAALGPQYQRYLWWKKYMTWIQLTQFFIMVVYLLSLLAYDCKSPKLLTIFFLVHVCIFLYLFADFYRKCYKGKKAKVT